MGLGVGDAQSAEGSWKGQRIPFDLGARRRILAPPYEISDDPLTWQHVLGLRFQQAARYQRDASRTWLATKILPAKESELWLQLMSLPLRLTIIVSKFASVGR